MLKSVRPFFSALETNLHQCLPQDEYRQVIDEALWELEGLEESDAFHNRSAQDPLLRMCNIALAVFRGMIKVGLNPELAQFNIAQALGQGNWGNLNAKENGSCLAAGYFTDKCALELCEKSFCPNCMQCKTDCPVTEQLRNLGPTAAAK